VNFEQREQMEEMLRELTSCAPHFGDFEYECLSGAIESLTESEYTVLVLVLWENHSLNEVATECGSSLGRVERIFNSSLKKIRRFLVNAQSPLLDQEAA